MYKLYLQTINKLICSEEEYENIEDAQQNYPPNVFVVEIQENKLVVRVKASKEQRNHMKNPGSNGCYY